MDTGITIALLLGGAQIIGSVIVLVSTCISNNNRKLKNEISQLNQRISKKDNRIIRFAKQVYFLRFVEESVYAELAKTNTSKKVRVIKQNVHGAIAKEISVNYESLDCEIRDVLEMSKPIEPINIDSYL